jgi:hypothetical protein
MPPWNIDCLELEALQKRAVQRGTLSRQPYLTTFTSSKRNSRVLNLSWASHPPGKTDSYHGRGNWKLTLSPDKLCHPLVYLPSVFSKGLPIFLKSHLLSPRSLLLPKSLHSSELSVFPYNALVQVKVNTFLCLYFLWSVNFIDPAMKPGRVEGKFFPFCSAQEGATHGQMELADMIHLTHIVFLKKKKKKADTYSLETWFLLEKWMT